MKLFGGTKNVKCPKCNSENPEQDIYCGQCGFMLKVPPNSLDLADFVEQKVRAEVEKLKFTPERQELALKEFEVEAINRALQKLQILGTIYLKWVGVPAVVFVAILAAVGIKTVSDINRYSGDAKREITADLTDIRTLRNVLKSEEGDLYQLHKERTEKVASLLHRFESVEATLDKAQKAEQTREQKINNIRDPKD